MRDKAREEQLTSMQEILGAASQMADERVLIAGDAFSKLANIDFKEVKSATDAFIQIGEAAKGLTSLIVAGQEEELNSLEKQKAKEIQLAGDDVAKKEQLEKKFNKKLAELKRRQFNEDKIKAIADIAISTSLAIAKAIAASPLTFGQPFATVAGAIGTAQIASVAARKAPDFTSGQVFAKGGISRYICG